MILLYHHEGWALAGESLIRSLDPSHEADFFVASFPLVYRVRGECRMQCILSFCARLQETRATAKAPEAQRLFAEPLRRGSPP